MSTEKKKGIFSSLGGWGGADLRLTNGAASLEASAEFCS